jgi:hypothetical protein
MIQSTGPLKTGVQLADFAVQKSRVTGWNRITYVYLTLIVIGLKNLKADYYIVVTLRVIENTRQQHASVFRRIINQNNKLQIRL